MATLGSKAVGSIVKLNVNGTARNFIVVNQGLPGSMYDASCDGTWLLMEDIYELRVWDSSDNDYANSDIHSYLNNTFINLFDSDIKSVIKQVKLPYTKGKGSSGSIQTGSSGISAKVFLLSYREVGFYAYNSTFANNEGYGLLYLEGSSYSKKIAKFNGTYDDWWFRSPQTAGTISAWRLDSNGLAGVKPTQNSLGVRPAMVLPYDLEVVGGIVIPASGAITGSVNIGGVDRELTGEGYINIGGVLRELSDSNVNIGGILKSLKG